MKCDKCTASAIIYQKYSGMHLCARHFQEDVHRKIRESLRESGIFGHGAKIAVGVNGSADSAVLIYVLKSLFSNRNDIELVAIMIDEGIVGYSHHALDYAIRLANELHVPYVIKSFIDAFGETIDGLHDIRELCSICKSMRNKLLLRTAVEVGATALATGNNLDTESAEIMLRYLSGDIEDTADVSSISSTLGVHSHNTGEQIPIIKPLRRIPAEEARLYAKNQRTPFASVPCPYARGLLADVKKELRDFEAKHPGTNYSLLRMQERVVKLRRSRDEEGQSL